MRIASFNVENLFERAKALNPGDWEAGRPTLEAHARINTLLAETEYTQAVRDEIAALLRQLGLERSDDGPLVRLQQIRGRLVTRPRGGGVVVTAAGRGDWVGWVELLTDRVDAQAMANTARVIKDVDADLLVVVEADNRVALERFAREAVDGEPAHHYGHVMLIDGRDERGIDVGLLTKDSYSIGTLRSHVDDVDEDGPVFSRDCPEYEITTPGARQIFVLPNHLKSKGFGSQQTSDAKRRRQATRVASIYRRLRDDGVEDIVVAGDFNDTPSSAALEPLISGTDLRDVSTHPAFYDGGRPGTYGNCTAGEKIDYLLFSPSLYARITGGGIFRKGAWGGTKGTLWSHYDTVHSPVEAASDHAALYADLDM